MLPAGTATAALSLTSAGLWGAGDFTGGIVTKRTSVFGVVVVAHTAGFLLVLATALLRHESVPPLGSFLWAIAGGLLGSVGLAAFYRSLAVGKMGINAPLAALITAVVPVIVGIALQGRPGRLQLLGFVIAILGIVLVSKPEAVHERPLGVGLAVVAGLGFGGFLSCMKLAGSSSVLWPLSVARLASAVLMLVLCLFFREPVVPRPQHLPMAMLTGLLDTSGNALFMLATQMGRLDVAAVLSSLYPVTTVILARCILKERMNRLQTTGMLAVLCSIPMIAG